MPNLRFRLCRVRPRFARDFHAAEHARDFVAALGSVEGFDLRLRTLAVARLRHAQVSVTLCRDLR